MYLCAWCLKRPEEGIVDPLQLKLQMTVKHSMAAANRSQVLCRSSKCSSALMYLFLWSWESKNGESQSCYTCTVSTKLHFNYGVFPLIANIFKKRKVAIMFYIQYTMGYLYLLVIPVNIFYVTT